MEYARTRLTKREMLEAVGPVMSAKLAGNNTLDFMTKEGMRIIRHWHTDIMIFTPMGDVWVNTWSDPVTVSTKTRVNKYLPAGYTLFVKQHENYVSVRGEYTVKVGSKFIIRSSGEVDTYSGI